MVPSHAKTIDKPHCTASSTFPKLPPRSRFSSPTRLGDHRTPGPDPRFAFCIFIALIPRKKRPGSAGTMASLNLSINGPSIKSSYQGVINGPALSSTSATAARWALFTVQAPLLNAFQNSGAKESILKVETTGGE